MTHIAVVVASNVDIFDSLRVRSSAALKQEVFTYFYIPSTETATASSFVSGLQP